MTLPEKKLYFSLLFWFCVSSLIPTLSSYILYYVLMQLWYSQTVGVHGEYEEFIQS